MHEIKKQLLAEEWRDIIGYEGVYQVSNLGRVRSLDRINYKNRFYKGIIKKLVKTGMPNNQYLSTSLNKEGVEKTKRVHVLVAQAFLKHIPDGTHNGYIVDHIDNNSLNNNLSNLQLITNRENLSKDRKGTSKYTGVSWRKDSRNWRARIKVNGKYLTLGTFDNELEASKVYQKALKELVND